MTLALQKNSIYDEGFLKKWTEFLEEKYFFTILLAVVLSFIWNGYRFPAADQVLQIPIAKNYFEPDMYPEDQMLAQENYKSFAWLILIIIGKLIPLWLLVLLIYIPSLWFYFHYIFKIGETVGKRRLGGILLVALSISIKPSLASIESHNDWLSLRVLSSPFVMAAIYYFLKDRPVASLVILGMSFNFHPISASNTAILIGTFLIFDSYHRRSKSPLFLLIKGSIGFVLASLPLTLFYGIDILAGSSSSSIFQSASKDWLEIMKIRNGHHSHPTEYPFWQYLHIFIYLIIIYRTKNWMPSVYHEKFKAMMIGMGILYLITFASVTVIPSSFIISLQFGRSMRFLGLIAMIYLIHPLLTLPKINEWGENEWQITTFGIIFLFYSHASIVVMILAFLFILIKIKINFNLRIFKIWKNNNNKINHKRFLVFILLVSTLPIMGAKIYLGIPPIADIQANASRSDPWIDIQYWVRENTHEDTILITPPHLEGFRVYSHRTIIGEWKDGTLSYFNTSFAYVWWERMVDLGFSEDGEDKYSNEIYLNLNFTSLSKKYSANYVIIDFRSPFQSLGYIEIIGDIIYTNKHFGVIKTEN
ncbi:MAG: DUF6798 domain-containing protein [Candidatus Kariarchaeaceae archaeon]|jgi:hypothetical protein